jgi:cytochrome c-type biogenesis protein CcmH/NrfG
MSVAANQAGSKNSGWTSTQAYVMAVICLLIGVAVGYLLRGSAVSGGQSAAVAAPVSGMPATPGSAGMNQQPSPEQLKQMADKQAAPLLERLKTSPNDPALLADIGNIYYDAQTYSEAVNYYGRSLKADPTNANVRTDMGTAYYYMGDSDRALSELQTALKYDPKHAQTFFNIGMIKWQAKMDINGAIAAWQELLAKNPDYPEKEKVQELIAQASKHSNIKPGTTTNKPPM